MIPSETNVARNIVTTLLRDVWRIKTLRFGYEELSETCLLRDINYITRRHAEEGMPFLTERMPALGKALDMALLGDANAFENSGFPLLEGHRYPAFMDWMFKLVLSPDGVVLKDAAPLAVRYIRQISFVFYKLEMPYSRSKVDAVLSAFVSNEVDLASVDAKLSEFFFELDTASSLPWDKLSYEQKVALSARYLLERVFDGFDVSECIPRHGPGAVSGKEKPWQKYRWSTVPQRTSDVFELMGNYYHSLDHLSERGGWFLPDVEPLARVALVPKDSRGPRLISAEPKELMFLQQGVKSAMYRRLEAHPLSKWSVYFTDQRPNQIAAKAGSNQPLPGYPGYATLDLKDASDRVSLVLVRGLLPPGLFRALEAVRSVGTVLPGGESMNLRKHAPMGSATCFPTMAAVLYALLAGMVAVQQSDPWFAGGLTRVSHSQRRRKKRATCFELEGIHVYGDDLIVPTAMADTAIKLLEWFGLKLNRSKSCTQGLFRESCGCDAFQGVVVTPQRIHCRWVSESPARTLASWASYCFGFANAGYHETGEYIARMVQSRFGFVPSEDDVVYKDAIVLPHEYVVPSSSSRKRWNPDLQRWEIRCRCVKNPTVTKYVPGRERLHRFLTESATPDSFEYDWESDCVSSPEPTTGTNQYTLRRSSMLDWRWCTTRPERGGGA